MANFRVIGRRTLDKDSKQITHIAYMESFFKPRIVISVQEVIRRIRINSKEFYIKEISDKLHYLKIDNTNADTPFIRTKQSKLVIENLLKLQAC
jgi:hypothetical protein